MKTNLLIGVILLIGLQAHSQDKSENELPFNFKNACFEHIEELVGYGIRSARLESGLKTQNFLISKFKEYGLQTFVDSFTCTKFEYDSAVTFINDESVHFSRIFVNPYLSGNILTSKGYILNTPLSELEDDLTDKIIIASESYSFFDLFKINTKAIIVVQDSVHSKLLRDMIDYEISLKLYGDIKKFQSYNIIGQLTSNNKKNKDIIITGHWDSKVGPGADDNATGISVMLELAKYFQQCDRLPFNIKFVATGAEEIGMLGSQAYMEKYETELENCLININIDAVGGNRDVMIEIHKSTEDEMKTYQGLPSTVRNCTGTDENHNWILISPEYYETVLFTEIQHINWIKESIDSASVKTNINYRFGMSDSDHRIIALAGVPAISFNVPGNRYHVSGDTPETVHKESLEKIGRLVKEIIINLETYN